MHQLGVAATSVDDVLEATGTGKSQFYYYFASKDQLVGEVLEHQLDVYLTAQPQLDDLSSWGAITEWLDGIGDAFERRDLIGGCPLGSLAAELADRDERMRTELARAFATWESFLASGLSVMKGRGELHVDADPNVLAERTIASIQGGYLLATTTKTMRPMRNVLQGALEHLRSYAPGLPRPA